MVSPTGKRQRPRLGRERQLVELEQQGWWQPWRSKGLPGTRCRTSARLNQGLPSRLAKERRPGSVETVRHQSSAPGLPGSLALAPCKSTCSPTARVCRTTSQPKPSASTVPSLASPSPRTHRKSRLGTPLLSTKPLLGTASPAVQYTPAAPSASMASALSPQLPNQTQRMLQTTHL